MSLVSPLVNASVPIVSSTDVNAQTAGAMNSGGGAVRGKDVKRMDDFGIAHNHGSAAERVGRRESMRV